jgi:hypothetical protein
MVTERISSVFKSINHKTGKIKNHVVSTEGVLVSLGCLHLDVGVSVTQGLVELLPGLLCICG